METITWKGEPITNLQELAEFQEYFLKTISRGMGFPISGFDTIYKEEKVTNWRKRIENLK